MFILLYLLHLWIGTYFKFTVQPALPFKTHAHLQFTICIYSRSVIYINIILNILWQLRVQVVLRHSLANAIALTVVSALLHFTCVPVLVWSARTYFHFNRFPVNTYSVMTALIGAMLINTIQTIFAFGTETSTLNTITTILLTWNITVFKLTIISNLTFFAFAFRFFIYFIFFTDTVSWTSVQA